MNKHIKKGDVIFVCAPANSMNEMSKEMISIGIKTLEKLGYKVQIGDNACASGEYGVASIQERLRDINAALENENVSLIMPAYGGYNSNDLLPYLDMELLHSKGITWCGYSDITALLNGIYSKTNIKMLHGVSFSTFCDKNMFHESLEIFKKVINGEKNIVLNAPQYYAEDLWFLGDIGSKREKYMNMGWQVYRQGTCEAKILGGNMETLLALTETKFSISLENSILLIETEPNVNVRQFVRDLSHFKQMGSLKTISGLIIGSFSKDSVLSNTDTLFNILDEYIGEYTYPVLSNVCLSHVDPIYTIPLGGIVKLECIEYSTITILDSLYA